MKKFIISTLLLTLCPQYSMAETNYAQVYQPVSKNVEYIAAQIEPAKQDTIFSQPAQIQPADTTTVEKTVISQKPVTKELKKKYGEITKNVKLIEACELLKNSAGNFSYRSIHGNNRTCAPIKISFMNFDKDAEHKNADAYGTYVGKKYEIYINSKYQDAPSAALAPLLAREALVSKDKTDSDKEAAEQLQIAVWSQMLEQNITLESLKNPLVIQQNKLKAGGNVDEYGAFLKDADSPKAKSFVPSKEVSRAFGKGAPTQADFDANKKAQGEKIDAEIMSYDNQTLLKKYKKITKDDRIIEALELLKDTVGKFSHEAILGKNLTHKPMVIKFKNLAELNPQYETFDALGWRQAGKLNIYINHKHFDAPAAALAALLAHEALHQDEFDSLNEETYAWTMEASVWAQLCDKQKNLDEITHPLVTRENLLKKLLEKGNYTNKYIKKSVFSNPSYSKLPARSPGFEDDI